MHALVKFMGIAWLIIGCLVITIGYFGVWMKGGFSALIDLLNPFNVANTLAVIITVGPGVLLLIWADKLKSKSAQ